MRTQASKNVMTLGVCINLRECAKVCVLPETDAETRVLAQIVHLGGEETPNRKGGNETRKERQPQNVHY